MDIDALPVAEFAFPGPLRDRLVTAILAGNKTGTCDLHESYERLGEPRPRPGRSAVLDSAGRRVAVIETTEVAILPLSGVDLTFARSEGEGFDTVAQWRAAHERFWTSEEYRAELGEPPITVDDSTLLVTERFHLVIRRVTWR